ncbi:MAG: hypothetical protein RXO24_09690 [Acidilobus sp.]
MKLAVDVLEAVAAGDDCLRSARVAEAALSAAVAVKLAVDVLEAVAAGV